MAAVRDVSPYDEQQWQLTIKSLRLGPISPYFYQIHEMRIISHPVDLSAYEWIDRQLYIRHSGRNIYPSLISGGGDTVEIIDPDRIGLIEKTRELFPRFWHKTQQEIIQELGQEIEEYEIDRARILAAQEWFQTVALPIPSDEQLKVIIDCSHSLRVIARAGSGKTRTVALKILFFVHYLDFRPDEILALAFNRNVRIELEQRVLQYERDAVLANKGEFRITTFDSLATNIAKPNANPIKDDAAQEIIKKLVLDAIDGEEGLRDQVEKLMINSFRSDWENTLRLDELSSQADLERLRSYLTEETLDGKQVKSRPEKRIADFLFEHDIPYLYECPFAVDEHNIIRPDFYIPSHKVVIEYYGLRGDPLYERSLAYKRRYWSKRADITLIEINPEMICKEVSSFDESREDDYLKLTLLLHEKTSHTPIPIVRLSDMDIIARLRNRIRLRFAELLQSAISRAGQLNCSEAELVNRIKDYQHTSEDERRFLDLLPSFITMYNDRLVANNLTDFNQIKKNAIARIHEGASSVVWGSGSIGINLKEVKFIFVDEYQDFSELFRGLVLAILKASPNALVNAVGDDWQMINRFAGSRPELFNMFEEDYPKAKTLYLQTNYRSSGGIVKFCNALMSSNGINGRDVTACDQLRDSESEITALYRDSVNITPIEDHYFKGERSLASIFRVFNLLTEKFPVHSRGVEDPICFAISRSNNPPLNQKAIDLGIRARNNRELINSLVGRLVPQPAGKFFAATTAHKSKGLEADGVIILQPMQFPMILQRSLFLRFFGDTPENLFRDELNLFYVACSRAKKNLYFLPENNSMNSPFLEGLHGYISVGTWDRYPPSLIGTLKLHKITVQECALGSGELFAAKDILIAHGFHFFSRPKQIPTRTRLVRMDFLATLLFLERLADACSSYSLKFSIHDALNTQLFSLPGPKSIRDILTELSH